MNRPRNELIARISEERARLAAIQEQKERSKRRLEELENQLAQLETRNRPDADHGDIDSPIPVTTAMEKVALFRSLFRGRFDVFPTRFVSKKTGKAGYAPSCANKFVRGVCDLPKVKCGECSNQAFHPADDRAVRKHLQGHQVMGVYPLLEDETCWFLAPASHPALRSSRTGLRQTGCRRN